MFIRQQKRAKTQMAQRIAKHTSRDAPRRHLSGHKCMFSANLGSRLGPACFQNGLRSPPGTLQKLHQSSSRRKNRPNQLPGGSRKVPRHPEGPPRHHFLLIFAWFLKAILEWKAIATVFSSRWCRICRISIKVKCWFEITRAAGANFLNINLSEGEHSNLFSGNVSRRSKLLKQK